MKDSLPEMPRGRTPIVWVNKADGAVLEMMHSLPLSSRTPEEIFVDRAIEFQAASSQSRSLRRRKHSRIRSEFVVKYLDTLDELTQAIGKRAAITMLGYSEVIQPDTTELHKNI